MPEACLRIFSDLHFRDPRGFLHNLDEFTPLLGDAERVIINGDAIDTQVPELSRNLAKLQAYLARCGREVTWLTGNHDPDVSAFAELSLRDERVWITHGDVFFDGIAPWSHHAAELRRRLAHEAAGLDPAQLACVETRLRLNRIVCRNLPEPDGHLAPGLVARVRRLIHTVFPPRRVFSMLNTWRITPRVVATLARAQRPRARVVVMGHTHYPGVWRPNGEAGPIVINTGSFTRPFGGLFVELKGEQVRVVRICHDSGGFRPGRTIAEFTLPPSTGH